MRNMKNLKKFCDNYSKIVVFGQTTSGKNYLIQKMQGTYFRELENSNCKIEFLQSKHKFSTMLAFSKKNAMEKIEEANINLQTIGCIFISYNVEEYIILN